MVDKRSKTFSSEPSLLVITCSSGVSRYLADEVRSLGFRVNRVSELAVETEGTLEDCMFLNINLRTAHRVLYALDKFVAKDPESLYNTAIKIPWENYLDPDRYFSIDRVVDTPTIRDTRYASLKLKDAIVDRMRQKCGMRPDSGNDRSNGVCIFLHWMRYDASIYIDTTGEALSKRGYRKESADAPVRESLAAALIMATGWDRESNFINPMCGCGTFAIEAALMAKNCPPAFLRDNFSFMHLVCFDYKKWSSLRAKIMSGLKKDVKCKIIASDIDEEAKEMTRRNAIAAGVVDLIEYDVCDFSLTKLPEIDDGKKGVIIMNPPYGERLGDPSRLIVLYSDMGVFLYENRESYDGYVLSGNASLCDSAGLLSDEVIKFQNGGIPCDFMKNPEPSKAALSKAKRRNQRDM